MEYDPIVEEVRASARQREIELGNDVARYCAHLREVQKEYAGRLVSAPLVSQPTPAAANQ